MIRAMEKEKMPCYQCRLRNLYDTNPKSLLARFWHWHTRFCPGWKAFMKSLSPEEQEAMRTRYQLK